MVLVRLCLHLLGLMATVISDVHWGLLMMKDFQCWVVASPELQGEGNTCIRGDCICDGEIHLPSRPIGCLAVGIVIQSNNDGHVPEGWGATMMGRAVNCKWHNEPRLT